MAFEHELLGKAVSVRDSRGQHQPGRIVGVWAEPGGGTIPAACKVLVADAAGGLSWVVVTDVRLTGGSESDG